MSLGNNYIGTGINFGTGTGLANTTSHGFGGRIGTAPTGLGLKASTGIGIGTSLATGIGMGTGLVMGTGIGTGIGTGTGLGTGIGTGTGLGLNTGLGIGTGGGLGNNAGLQIGTATQQPQVGQTKPFTLQDAPLGRKKKIQ